MAHEWLTGEVPTASAMFMTNGAMSEGEDEGKDDANPPNWPSCKWRHHDLTKILYILDQCWIDSKPPGRLIKQRIEKVAIWRASPNAMIVEGFGAIPGKLPRIWIFQEATQSLNQVQLRSYSFLAPVKLASILTRLQEITGIKE